MTILFLYLLASLGWCIAATASAQQQVNEDRFKTLVKKMESDVIALARQVENLYVNERCKDATLQSCNSSNYDHCLSKFPHPTCAVGGADLLDFTTTAVRLPSGAATGPRSNPQDPAILETVCFTRSLDNWFEQKREQDASFWQQFGGEPRSAYFGAANGAFRIYPARSSETCGTYDPRVRPWYVAASSGPKNLVLLLDVSGSMSGRLLRLMKQAAKRVILTLTVGDRVAIVPFETEAEVIADRGMYLYTATALNKEILVQLIENLEAGGKTNFNSAFTKAFDLLDTSISEELNVPCNSAILFLTDGKMTVPEYITETQVIDLVIQRIAQTKSMNGQLPMLLFTYSVSEHDEGVHSFPSKLACSVEQGMWSKISNYEEILESLSYIVAFKGTNSELRFNSFPCLQAPTTNFSLWASGQRPILILQLGWNPTSLRQATCSERPSRSPCTTAPSQRRFFIGVVGVDFSLEALNHALDKTSSSESIRRVVFASTARCPLLKLSPCELDSYRRLSNPEGLCNDFCSEEDFVEVVESRCATASDFLPRNLWANTANAGLSYKERGCCDTTSDTLLYQCAARGGKKSSKTGIIVGVVIAAVVFVFVLSLLVAKCMGLCCWAPGIPVFSEKPAVAVVPSKVTTVAVEQPWSQTASATSSAPNITQPPPPLNPNYQDESQTAATPLECSATTDF